MRNVRLLVFYHFGFIFSSFCGCIAKRVKFEFEQCEDTHILWGDEYE